MPKITRRSILGGVGATVVMGSADLRPAAAKPSTTTDLTADVCVVGAGFAGLTAAYRLQQAGASVIVLEARNRIGGRSWTGKAPDGSWVDWGGQWVGKTQDRFYALIEEMGAKWYRSQGEGLKYVRRTLTPDRKLQQIGDNADDPKPISAIYRQIDRLARTIDPKAPWAHKDALRLDGVTFSQWLRQASDNEEVRRWAGVEIGSVPCASPQEISILHLAWLIRSCNYINMLFSFSGGAQQDRVIGGTQPVAQRVAAKLGDAVKLGEPVRRIEWRPRGAVVQSDQISVAARHVIIAVPPHLAGAIEFEPTLPIHRVQVTQRWAQGLVIKVSMVYSEPFWREAGLSGKSFDYTALMSETADSSAPPEHSRLGVLTGFVYADSARKVSLLGAGERKKTLLGEAAQRFGQKALEPMEYHESNWTMLQWTRGCFTGFLTPGATALFGSAVRDPVGPLHWAGTETATEWPSFIEGAIRSGERAAAEIRKA